MTHEPTVNAKSNEAANVGHGPKRAWLRRLAAAGALALGLLSGTRGEAQGLTPGGPIDFGSQPVGGPQTTLTLTFSASVATTIQSVNALTLGVANKDFTVVSQTCTGSLAPPQSCNVNIGFVASTPGLRRGALTLVDSSGAVVNQVFLHGVGVGPQVVVSPGAATALTTLPGIAPSGFQTSGVAIDGAGTIYFNDYQFSRILKMTSAGTVSLVAPLATTANTSLALDGSGTLYVTSGTSVYKIPANGAPAIFPTGSITMTAPRGVAVDGTGYVYLSDATLNEIVRVAPDGSSTVFAISGLSTPLNKPAGLVIDAANVLHIADTGNARVVNVGIYNGTSVDKAVQLSSPIGVAVDGANSVLVTDPAVPRVMVSPSNNSNYYQLIPVGAALNNPVNLAVKDNGDVVIADTANGLITVARTAAQVVFRTSTYVGQQDAEGPLQYYVQNSGNVALQFIVPSTGTNPTVDNTAFAVSTGTATSCPQLTTSSTASSSTQLAQGAQCTYGVNFTPSLVGANTGHATTTLTTVTPSTTTFAPVATLTGTGLSNTVAFKVTATPSPTQPGSLVSVTVAAQTAAGTVDTLYTGTVTLTATDPAATFPGGASSYTFSASDAGTHTFPAPAGVVFNTLGTFTVKATDGTYTGTSNTVQVVKASSFAITATPSSINSGDSVGYTVSAMFNGAVVTNYTGTVTFSATDPAAQFVGPTSYTFTAADNGTHTFTTAQGVRFNTNGTYTIGATDGTATGTSNAILVGGLTGITIQTSTNTARVGGTITYTVTVMSGPTVATGFTGTVTFTSTDSTAVFLPSSSYTFTAADQGTHTFTAPAAGVMFNQPGVFTISAANGSLTATSQAVRVFGATSLQLVLSPSSTQAGTPVSLTVSALSGSEVSSAYRGTVMFTSTDPAVVFLSGNSYTFTAADAGVHTFAAPAGVQFNTGGQQTVTGTDSNNTGGALSGTSNVETVSTTVASGFTVTPVANSVRAGVPLTFTVTALNGTSTQTGFVGTITLTSSDGTAVFPGGSTYTFTAADNGTHTFTAPGAGVQFNQAGLFTVTATSGAASGTSQGVRVFTATSLQLTLSPTTTTAGTPVALTVTALNGSSTATAYRGTVTFTSTDPAVSFLSGTSYTFTSADAGTHTFAAPAGVQFMTTGVQTVTGTDSNNGGATLTATSNGVTVNPVTPTSFVVQTAANQATVGTGLSYTVTAMTGSSVATGFVGTVTFTSTDSTAAFPAGTTYTFTAADQGVHTFTAPGAGIVFNQEGLFTLTATSGSASGTSQFVRVFSATSLQVTLSPTTTTAGVPVSMTVTALNGAATATAYRGTVTFTSTDPAVAFLAGTSYTFTAADAGTHTFTAATAGVTFNTAGNQTVTVNDGRLSATSNAVTVNGTTTGGNTADGFTIVATPASTTIGTPVSYTITATNGGATATGFTGTVTLTSTDSTATFLNGTTYTFTTADNGSHTFSAPTSGIKFNRAGVFTITATSGTASGTSNSVTVSAPSSATAFTLTASPATTGVGTPVGLTISAVNSSGAVATDYVGTVTFSSSDPLAKFLGGTTYKFTAADAGTHTFAAASGVQFNTAGTQTASATDGSISGTSNSVTVLAADSFTIVATPTTTTADSPVSFTITAKLGGATATNFTGTVTLSSTDGLAKFLGGTTYTFTTADQGVHTFSGASAVKFESTGTFTIGATAGTVTGTSNSVTVLAPASFQITVNPSSTTAGAPVSFTVSAVNGSTVNTSYTGTVTFTSTDSTAKFLSGTTYTFTNLDQGTHTFTAPASGVTFNQGGTFTVSATDGTLNGTSNNVTVLAATGFTVTATPTTTNIGKTVTFVVTAVNGSTTIPNYTGTITLSSTDSSATFLGGTTYTFTAADQGTHTFTAPIAGVAFNQTGTFTVTATSGALTGTSNGVLVTASGTGFTITATPTSTTVGSPVSFTITANGGGGVNTAYRGTVTFTSTDPLAKFLSGTTYTFTAADNGTHTFQAPASGVQFNEGGTYTITATDGTLSGTSNAVTVLAPTGFAIVATPSSTSIGSTVSYTITAVNVGTGGTTVVPNYTGTVTFSSTDTTAKFLSGITYTFTAADKGTHTFNAPASGVQFNQAGTFTISATDGSTNGTSNSVVVNPIASAFTIVATPSTTSVGAPVSFTISATNGSTVVTNYTGTVNFTTTDTTGKFLSGNSYTFTAADNGTHTFTAPTSGVQFNQAGSFTVSASDGTIHGTSNVVVVDPKAASFVITASPATTTVGTPVSFTVSAVNNGSVVPGYTGTVTFSSTDAGAFFLSGTSYTFTAADNGVKTFTAPASGVKFSQTGTFTISATDGTISGTSNSVVVNPTTTGFTITATPSTTTVGTAISYTVTALSGGGTANTGYTGTVTFSSTDTGATFLSGTSYTFTAADSGTHTFTAPASGVKFSKAGTFTISATDGTNSGTSNAVVVNPVVTGFSVVATPSTTTVGTPVSYTVTALSGTTTVTGYVGTVTFSSTDTGATFLSGTSYTFTAADNGTHTFAAPASGVKFSKAGTFTITATDGTNTGTSNSVLVNPSATGFTITASPANTTVGTPVSYTVTAVNGTTTIAGYTGTVTFSSTDTGATFLSGTSYTFTAADNGTHTFTAPASGVKFSKTGTFTISATDGTISGTSNNVVVGPVATSFSIVAAPSTTTVGSPVSLTITALNGTATATGYTGTVTFSSTDTTAKFLSGTSYTFTAADNGTHTFTASAGVQFNTAGTFTVSGTDGTISGTSNSVVVSPLATGFVITATPSTTTVGGVVSFTITAVNGGTTSTAYTGTVTLSSTDATAKFLSGSTVVFTAADSGVETFTAPASGVQFNTAGTFTISATDGTISGTSNSVLVNRVATGFTITATPATTNVGGVVSFTVTAVNGGTVVPTYMGTVALSSTDTTAKFLSGTTLTFTAADNGTKTFTAPASGVQFNAPGVFTIGATDGTISGTSNSVTVVGPDAFTVTASPSTTTIGVPVGFTVAATYKGTVVPSYTGTVTLSSTDPLAKFLSGNTFTFTAAEQGVHVVTAANGVSFGTLGTFTINAASGTVTGVSNPVHVTSVSTVLLTSSANPVLTGTSITLTATVPAANGSTPTGTVVFQDGGNTIGTATLVNGVAKLTNVSFTLLGTHSLTVSYSGDNNFSAATSAALGEIVEDFSIGIAAGASNSMTALGGHTATYSLALTPLGGPTFAAPITFTATGMPSGSTISFTPASLLAGSSAATVKFSVTPPVKVGALAKGEDGTKLAHLAPLTAVLVMLSLGAFGNRRKRLTRLLVFALAALPLSAMTGCLNSANDGYYGAAPTTYTITITATSGSLTHTTQVTLSTQ